MDFDEYISQFQCLSETKRLILEALWGTEHATFPRPWVRSSRLLELTGQKYFDRRIRELRDECGCDIETGTVGSWHCYRIRSSSLNAANPRIYLTSAQKLALFQQFDSRCQICGKQATGGVRGLQADHKIPLIRGGSHLASNWQAICNECNVGKRAACEGCADDCQKCPWAVPESVGKVALVRLPPALMNALRTKFGSSQAQLEAAIVTAITKHIQS